jgi:hypothetical protein
MFLAGLMLAAARKRLGIMNGEVVLAVCGKIAALFV